MNRQRRRLLFVGSFLFLAVIVSLLGFRMVRTMNRLVAEDARGVLNEIATQSVMRLRTAISSEMASLEFQANFIAQYDDMQGDQVMAILREEAEAGAFIRLGVILPNGDSVNSDDYAVNLSHRQYFQKAMEGIPNISEVLRHTKNPEELIVAIAVPIKREGKVVGVLRGARFVDDYAEMLQVTTFGGVGNAYVVKHTGEVVLSNTSPSEDIFSTSIPYARLPVFSTDPSLRTMMNSMVRGESGMIQSGTGYSSRFVDYRPLGINDWYVVSVISETQMMGKVSSILKVTATTVVVTVSLLLIVLLAFVLLRERRQELLEQIAFVDPLTALGTWERLRFETRNRLRDLARKHHWYVLIDVDRLKLINTAAGFTTGDMILKRMGEILSESIGDGEHAVRVVNDRFALLLQSEAPVGKRVGRILDRLDSIAHEDWLSPRTDVSLTYSCGIYPLQETDTSIEHVHDKAQLALETVKTNRITTYAYYDEALHRNMQRQQELERRFDHALEHQEFVVYLQPKFHIASMRIVGAEALLRWHHPELGLLPPGEFIPMLEENSRIVDLDTYVMRQVCNLLVAWQSAGAPLLPVSVNISRADALSTSFPERCIGIADACGIERHLIEIELTETAFADDPERLLANVRRLREAGFLVSIDDFGSGYSSLHLLKDLEADTLKIDRQFLRNHLPGDRSEVVIRHVLALAEELGMVVVAEGVESVEQLDFLRSVHCQQAQGFLLARPMPLDGFESFRAKALNH